MLRLFEKKFFVDVKAKYLYWRPKCGAWRQNDRGLER